MTVPEASMYSRVEIPPMGPTSSRRAPRPGTAGPRSTGRLQRAVDTTVTREITAALREAEGNMAQAARDLGISYKGLWKRMRSLSIDPERFRR